MTVMVPVWRIFRSWPLGRGVLVFGLVCCGASACSSTSDGDAPTPTDAVIEWRFDGPTPGLDEVRAVRVSRSGQVAVGQETEGKILLLTPNGELVGTAGRTGEGPGEFSGSPVFNWVDDSLFAGDARLSVFTPSGQLIRSQPWPGTPSLIVAGSIYHPFFGGGVMVGIRHNADRILIATVNGSSAEHPPEWGSEVGSPQQAVIRVAPDGAVRVIYARGPITLPIGCRGEFCRRELVATSPDGEQVTIASLEREGEDSITYRVATFDADGDTLFTHLLSIPQQEISDAAWDSLDAGRQGAQPRTDAADLNGRGVGGQDGGRGTPPLPRVRTYPGLRSLVVSRNGEVWAQQFTNHHWIVLATDGTIRRRVSLGPRVRLHAVAGDTLWVVSENETGVPSVLRMLLAAGRP